MTSPPRAARLHLYSCECGRALVPWLRGNFVLGHFGPVPIPSSATHDVVLTFLNEVRAIIDGNLRTVHEGMERLRKTASSILRAQFFDTGIAFEAALLLNLSLYE